MSKIFSIFIFIITLFLFFKDYNLERYKVSISLIGLNCKTVHNEIVSNISTSLLEIENIKNVVTKSYDNFGILYIKCKNCYSEINSTMQKYNFEYAIDKEYFKKSFNILISSNDYKKLYDYGVIIQNEILSNNGKAKIYGKNREIVEITPKYANFYNLDLSLMEFINAIKNANVVYGAKYLTNKENIFFSFIQGKKDIENILIKIKNALYNLSDLFEIKDASYPILNEEIFYSNKKSLLIKTNKKVKIKDNGTINCHYLKFQTPDLYIKINSNKNFELLSKLENIFKKYGLKYVLFFGNNPIKPDFTENNNFLYITFESKFPKEKLEKALDELGASYYFKFDSIIKIKIYTHCLEELQKIKNIVLNELKQSIDLKIINANMDEKNSNTIEFNDKLILQAGFSNNEIINYLMTFLIGEEIGYFYRKSIKNYIVFKNNSNDYNFNIYSKKFKKYFPIYNFYTRQNNATFDSINMENNQYYLETIFKCNNSLQKLIAYFKIYKQMKKYNLKYTFKID